jgi:hypothetical protein
MWAASLVVAIGSYTVLAVSFIGHVVLIGAAAITISTYNAAATRPTLFMRGSGRGENGERE